MLDEERRIKLSVVQQQGHTSRAWVTKDVGEEQEPEQPSFFQRASLAASALLQRISPWAWEQARS